MDVDIKYATPESEIKDSTNHAKASSISIFVSDPLPPKPHTGKMN